MTAVLLAILNELRKHGVPYKQIHTNGSISYSGCSRLHQEQDTYRPNCMYFGSAADYNPSLAREESGFFLSGAENVQLAETCEYVFVEEQYEDNVFDIVSCFLSKPTSPSNSSDALTLPEISNVFMSALLRDKGMKYLIDICCDILKNPIFLTEPYHRDWFIYSDRYKLKAPDIQRILRDRNLPQSYLMSHDKLGTLDKLLTSNRPFLLDSDMFSNSKRIVQGIWVDRSMVAVLSVFDSNRPFAEQDYSTVEFLGAVIAEEIRRKGAPINALYEYQLQNMLRGEPVSNKQREEWLAALEWNAVHGFRLCVIRAEESQRYQIEADFRRKYSNAQNCKATRVGNHIVLLCNSTSDRAWLDFLTELDAYLCAGKLCCIVSGSFDRLEDLPFQFSSVSEALAVGAILFPCNALVEYEQIAMYCLIHQAAASGEVKQYLSVKLMRLKEYDQNYGTEYYQTLKIYLMSGNKKQAAERLQIHKNTMNYRLQKLQEILEVDIEDATIRFEFQLSLCIDRYLEAAES